MLDIYEWSFLYHLFSSSCSTFFPRHFDLFEFGGKILAMCAGLSTLFDFYSDDGSGFLWKQVKSVLVLLLSFRGFIPPLFLFIHN